MGYLVASDWFIGHRFSVLKPTPMAMRSSLEGTAKIRFSERLARSSDGRLWLGTVQIGDVRWAAGSERTRPNDQKLCQESRQCRETIIL